MKLSVALSIFSLFITFNLTSQNLEIGKPILAKQTFIESAITQTEEGDFIGVIVRGSLLGDYRRKIVRFDKNLLFKKEKELKDILYVGQTKDMPFVTYYNDEKSQMLSELDTETLSYTDNAKEIFSIKQKTNLFKTQSFAGGEPKYSPDSSKVAFVAQKIVKNTSLPILYYTVFDSNLSVLAKKKIEINLKEKNYTLLSSQVTNDGQILLLSNEKKEKSRFLVATMIDTQGVKKKFEVEIKKGDITDAIFQKHGNQYKIVAFQNMNERISIIITAHADQNMNLIDKKFRVIDKYKHLKDNPKHKYKTNDHKIVALKVINDKTLVFTEQQYITFNSSAGFNGMPGVETITSHSNDILIYAFDSDNKHEWTRIIPKKQIGEIYHGSAIYHSHDGDLSYILFNDHFKNLNSKSKIKTTKGRLKNNIIKMVTLNNMTGAIMESVITKEKGVSLGCFDHNFFNGNTLYLFTKQKDSKGALSTLKL